MGFLLKADPTLHLDGLGDLQLDSGELALGDRDVLFGVGYRIHVCLPILLLYKVRSDII